MLVILSDSHNLLTPNAFLDWNDAGISRPVVNLFSTCRIFKGIDVPVCLFCREKNEKVCVTNDLVSQVAVFGQFGAHLSGKLTAEGVSLSHFTANCITKECIRADWTWHCFAKVQSAKAVGAVLIHWALSGTSLKGDHLLVEYNSVLCNVNVDAKAIIFKNVNFVENVSRRSSWLFFLWSCICFCWLDGKYAIIKWYQFDVQNKHVRLPFACRLPLGALYEAD